jgi:hypothetical protein
MQLTIRSITRGLLAGTMPALLGMALVTSDAWAQSGSGSSGSSQSSGSQSSSRQSQSDDDASSNRSSQSDRDQSTSSQQDDSDSSQRQRSSSGLGQSNRDRDSDTTSSQQRRSRSQDDQSSQYQDDDRSQSSQSQSSQRSRGLGQTNRDRSDDDSRSQQSRNRQFSQDDDRFSQDDDRSSRQSQSDRQRSGAQFRDDQPQDDQFSQGRRSRQSQDSESQQSFSQDQSSNRQRQMGLSFSSREDDGLVISQVNPQSIAARSGLRSGDEIVAINGRRIDSRSEWNEWIQDSRGSRLNVLVRRNGREIPLALTMTDRTWQQQGVAQQEYDYARDGDYSSRASLGVVLDPRYLQGAMVDRVYRDSPAEEAGLQRGDYIIALDGQRINSPQDLVRAISRMEPGSDVEIEFTRRQRDSAYVTLGSQAERQDGSFSLTQERRSGDNQQRSATRQRFEDDQEFRD